MAHTLVAFHESIDAAAAYDFLAAIADQHMFVSGDDLRVPPTYNQIVYVAALVGSGGNGNARLVSPSLRRRHQLVIEPVMGRNDGNVEPGSPHAVLDFRRLPIPLVTGEQLNAQVHSDTTAAARQSVLVGLAAGPIEPVAGAMFTTRWTGTTTLVAGAWTTGTITPEDDLPAGRYQVVGMRARAAGLVAARLIFGGSGWRPGCIGTDAQEDLEHPMFRLGGLGVLGEFDEANPPQVEYLSISADTAETVYLDLIQLAAA